MFKSKEIKALTERIEILEQIIKQLAQKLNSIDEEIHPKTF
jgi:predicted  nucleic acid-binding Zn-ribbon protein